MHILKTCVSVSMCTSFIILLNNSADKMGLGEIKHCSVSGCNPSRVLTKPNATSLPKNFITMETVSANSVQVFA